MWWLVTSWSLTLGDAVFGRQEALPEQALQHRADGRPVHQLQHEQVGLWRGRWVRGRGWGPPVGAAYTPTSCTSCPLLVRAPSPRAPRAPCEQHPGVHDGPGPAWSPQLGRFQGQPLASGRTGPLSHIGSATASGPSEQGLTREQGGPSLGRGVGWGVEDRYSQTCGP